MNQYERIVSYIYQYEGDEKGANAGFAKLEKRGSQCRFSVQIRAVALKEVPKVYFYRQLSDGIQTICAGSMVFRGNNMVWKATSDTDRLFQSGWNIEEVDGIFIDGADEIYFVTSWKQDSFYLGNWNKSSTGVVKEKAVVETETVQDSPSKEIVKKSEQEVNIDKDERKIEEIKIETAEIVSKSVQTVAQNAMKNCMFQNTDDFKNEVPNDIIDDTIKDDLEDNVQKDIQMQSICGVCPFKRKVYDYGKKILMTFPSMKPFQNGVAEACVRMELQDIGCLPIASWSLSGNRFLLHGYYCYRHLIFAQLADGRYVLGVPGVFSEKERRNAHKFGFSDFQSIGDFGMQQGAFGYWFQELPKGDI